MTTKRLYSCKDKQTGHFYSPMTFTTDRDAIDSFSMAVNQENSIFGKHPDDFSLNLIGEFNESNANLDVLGPSVIVEAASLLN